MSKVNITIDTVSKELSIDIDGEKLDDSISFHGYIDDNGNLSFCMQETEMMEDNVMRILEYRLGGPDYSYAMAREGFEKSKFDNLLLRKGKDKLSHDISRFLGR